MDNQHREALIRAKATEIEIGLVTWAAQTEGLLPFGHRFKFVLGTEPVVLVVSSIELAPENADQSPLVVDLGFSTRTRGVLSRSGIETLDQLCEKTPEELVKYRNFGKKSLLEVIDKLIELGRNLAGISDMPFLAASVRTTNSLEVREDLSKVLVRPFSADEWDRMLKAVGRHDYMVATIRKFRKKGFGALLAGKVLEDVWHRSGRNVYKTPGSSMGTVYRINQQFRMAGLPYRIIPTGIPAGKHCLSERKLEIGELRLGN